MLFYMSRATARRSIAEANEILEQCEREGRNPTEAERRYAERLIAEAKSQAGMPDFGNGFHDVMSGGGGNVSQGGRQLFASPGEAFTASPEYKRIKGGRRSETWSTGMVDVSAAMFKGTLLETAAGGGAGLIPVPQVVPAVVDKLFQRLTVESLLQSGQATTTSVRYATEGTATSGAAGVAEGGAKPESTLGYTTTDEPIKKVATSVIVSDELLDDVPAVQSFINSRLALFVQIEVERELLRGTSGGNEVQGLLTSRGVPVYAGGTAAGNRAVQLFKAMNGVRGSAFTEPDWVIMTPADWEIVRSPTAAGSTSAAARWVTPTAGRSRPTHPARSRVPPTRSGTSRSTSARHWVRAPQ